jgi:hypothetical protein
MIVACVRTGTKYGIDYVYRLHGMVKRHLRTPHRFVCLTDRPQDLPGIECIDVSSYGLPGWFAKMILFEPEWRAGERVLYFDLDTVICGDLTALAGLEVEFGICANFTKLKGLRTVCSYGSCVMTIAPDRLCEVWEQFWDEPQGWIDAAGPHGDQWIIEKLAPAATLLQDACPGGFFLGYRDLTDRKPPGCSLVIFAGRSKPHTCNEEWIVTEWTP